MIARKRERATFEALQDLVLYLGAIREERKAIITVTEGWVRFRPDHDMMRLEENGDWHTGAYSGTERHRRGSRRQADDQREHATRIPIR